jgi:hypothetical protein
VASGSSPSWSKVKGQRSILDLIEHVKKQETRNRETEKERQRGRETERQRDSKTAAFDVEWCKVTSGSSPSCLNVER